MKVKVYNLELPPYVEKMTIGGYLFERVKDYEEKVKTLHQLVDVMGSEFHIKPCTDSHQITATVQKPQKEKKAILPFGRKTATQLEDILLMLTIFTGRNVFQVSKSEEALPVITDPRLHHYRGALCCSFKYDSEFFDRDTQKVIPKKKANYMTYPMLVQRDLALERGINSLLLLIGSKKWKQEYDGGYYLFLYKQAIQRASIETNFILSWSIWEHLFAVHNRNWLSEEKLRKAQRAEKIAFILTKYFVDKIDKNGHKEIERLTRARNRLIHYGKKPDNVDIKEMDFFIRATECVVAKTFDLIPSNIFNVNEKVAEFLHISK